MEERHMTVAQVLADIQQKLGAINVPANRIEDIGIPIAQAINGIGVCLEAMQQEEEARKEQEPEIEIFPVEEPKNDA